MNLVIRWRTVNFIHFSHWIFKFIWRYDYSRLVRLFWRTHHRQQLQRFHERFEIWVHIGSLLDLFSDVKSDCEIYSEFVVSSLMIKVHIKKSFSFFFFPAIIYWKVVVPYKACCYILFSGLSGQLVCRLYEFSGWFTSVRLCQRRLKIS